MSGKGASFRGVLVDPWESRMLPTGAVVPSCRPAQRPSTVQASDADKSLRQAPGVEFYARMPV